MCGIVGYVGSRPAKQILYGNLKRLEYRGYDSAGIAVLDPKTSEVVRIRAVGDTSQLALDELSDTATIGIGHTRWATHGKPTVENAHPHTFNDVTLVHNGIIENFEELKATIDASKLTGQTDSEVLAVVIDQHFQETHDMLKALQKALKRVTGTFGLVVMSPKSPQELFVARRGSPIAVGVGDVQNFIASDSSAIIDHTDKVVFLDDDQIAHVTADEVRVFDVKLTPQTHDVTTLENLQSQGTLGSHSSFLEKEIYEQPESLTNVMRGRVYDNGVIKLGGPNLSHEDIAALKHILIIGCGTSYYAGLFAKYQLEEMLNIPVSVEYASEFRYRFGAYDTEHTLAIFMSQSGETADVMASLQEAQRRSIKTMGIINAVGSTIARSVDHGGIYLHAGEEVSVASSKAYSSMVVALLMFGGQLVYERGGNGSITQSLARELVALPEHVTSILELHDEIRKIARHITKFDTLFYLGRRELYPVSLEGALKMTEVSYIHAQAFPSGEMKHGPISLVDAKHLSVLLLSHDDLLYEKGISALQELKARDGSILTISTRPKPRGSDYHIQIPHLGEYADGLLYNVCLQLLALEVATLRGVNIDRPRNLAKSVTVE